MAAQVAPASAATAEEVGQPTFQMVPQGLVSPQSPRQPLVMVDKPHMVPQPLGQKIPSLPIVHHYIQDPSVGTSGGLSQLPRPKAFPLPAMIESALQARDNGTATPGVRPITTDNSSTSTPSSAGASKSDDNKSPVSSLSPQFPGQAGTVGCYNDPQYSQHATRMAPHVLPHLNMALGRQSQFRPANQNFGVTMQPSASPGAASLTQYAPSPLPDGQTPPPTGPGFVSELDPLIVEMTRRTKRGRKKVDNFPDDPKVARNREAQRNFRDRKEKYLRSLEHKVQQYESIFGQRPPADVLAEIAALQAQVSTLKKEREVLVHLGVQNQHSGDKGDCKTAQPFIVLHDGTTIASPRALVPPTVEVQVLRPEDRMDVSPGKQDCQESRSVHSLPVFPRYQQRQEVDSNGRPAVAYLVQ